MKKNNIHQQLADIGLERIEYTETSTYRFNTTDSNAAVSRPFSLTTITSESGQTNVHFDEAAFEDNAAIPPHIRQTALEKLRELKRVSDGGVSGQISRTSGTANSSDTNQELAYSNSQQTTDEGSVPSGDEENRPVTARANSSGSGSKSLDEANNGSMAQDLGEIKKLGNEMKKMKTNSELLEKNMVPDPVQ